MSAGSTSLTCATERVPRWSSTGHARTRPDGWPALLPALHSSQKTIVLGAQANPISPASWRNHTTVALAFLATTPIAAVKSP